MLNQALPKSHEAEERQEITATSVVNHSFLLKLLRITATTASATVAAVTTFTSYTMLVEAPVGPSGTVGLPTNAG